MTNALAAAEAALERGDYGQCIALLEPLAEANPISDSRGAEIRMLMVTAWMGKGDENKALSTCRLLTRCKDPDLRIRARQLLDVLEAPSLARPANWSMQLPTLEMDPRVGKRSKLFNRRKLPPPPPSPPTGPTRAPAGFALLVIAVLVGLTLLLSGCVRITADLSLPGPDRVEMAWTIDSRSGLNLPWQDAFSRELRVMNLPWKIRNAGHGHLEVKAPTQTSEDAAALLSQTVEAAGRTAGLSLPAPSLQLTERNWLVGLKQELLLELDLSALESLNELQIAVRLGEQASLRSLQSSPAVASKNAKGELIWPLRIGVQNRLQWSQWRWSRLGLGSLAILALLVLTASLQRLRLLMGFGYPELPS
ncbi:MAG: DUF3153 domain-containing protein [Synechococcus sp. s2_metabat2_7]|nr:DUF3153 domain-containing protein [Synechococcus sp. s2_metabat2_7]